MATKDKLLGEFKITKNATGAVTGIRLDIDGVMHTIAPGGIVEDVATGTARDVEEAHKAIASALKKLGGRKAPLTTSEITELAARLPTAGTSGITALENELEHFGNLQKLMTELNEVAAKTLTGANAEQAVIRAYANSEGLLKHLDPDHITKAVSALGLKDEAKDLFNNQVKAAKGISAELQALKASTSTDVLATLNHGEKQVEAIEKILQKHFKPGLDLGKVIPPEVQSHVTRTLGGHDTFGAVASKFEGEFKAAQTSLTGSKGLIAELQNAHDALLHAKGKMFPGDSIGVAEDELKTASENIKKFLEKKPAAQAAYQHVVEDSKLVSDEVKKILGNNKIVSEAVKDAGTTATKEGGKLFSGGKGFLGLMHTEETLGKAAVEAGKKGGFRTVKAAIIAAPVVAIGALLLNGNKGEQQGFADKVLAGREGAQQGLGV